MLSFLGPSASQINELTTPTDDLRALPPHLRRKRASDAWPSCFYAENSFNPDDPENGLFCSQFILRVLRHTWTTPSSAIDGCTKIPKICHANGHRQFKVTLEAWLRMRSSPNHDLDKRMDGRRTAPTNMTRCSDNVLALFEADETDPWAVETLEWLQNGVFGVADDDSDDSGDEEGAESPATRVRKRRAARRRGCFFPIL
ncbi:hypothetical protein R3P38DRAFT_3237772 [Favolaschia claudopus]|uniref:Uncharacterized protein n=1 Tax=Favolaschia claudopus TaxID=2862362 RepID=A0AAV9ZAE7_9AGAR